MNAGVRRGPSSGLTLIEAALAIGLLGLVAAAAFTAAAIGMQAWTDGREATAAHRRDAIWSDRLQSAIASMVPMAALTDEHPGVRTVFFQGNAYGMRFVTAHSPSADGRGGVRLVELRSENLGSGTELVLREDPCPTVAILGMLLDDPSWAVRPSGQDAGTAFWRGGRAVRVMSQPLSAWKFEYLTDASASQQSGEWVSRWEDRRAIPRAVRIEWVNERARGRRSSAITGVVIGPSSALDGVGL